MYSSPPLCPIRPARRVLINNSSFNLIPHSHSQCVSHIFNNGAAVNNTPPPTTTQTMFCGGVGRAGVWNYEEERKRSQVHHHSASPQVDNQQIHALLQHIHPCVGLLVFVICTPNIRKSPHPPNCHRSEDGAGCSLIKHLFSCQWEAGQSKLIKMKECF